METDVLIVGAGPTGLSLACQFIRYGIDCIIIERNEGVTPFSKALGVHARTLEIYEQLGLAEEAVAQGTIVGKVRLLEGGRVRGEVDLSNLGEGLSAYPYMLVLEQSKNEQLLYEYMRKHGRDVLWGTELESFSQTREGVTAHVRDASGAAQTIEAKYLAGCDGPKSTVRHTLALAFEGSTFERLFYVADVQVDWEFSHDALHVCLARNSLVAFFPMQGEKRYRIVGTFPEGVDKDEARVRFDQIEERIREEAEVPLDISHVDWFSVYRVHSRHVEKLSEGRCFLAGDAAHIHTPAGAQGMNTGIQDAYNLAWKLAFVLEGSASERILDSYNQERLENAKRLLGTTDRMFSVAAGGDWLLNFIRSTVFPPLAKYIMAADAVRKRFFPMISQIGISYRADELSDHDGDDGFAVKAGDRLPYCLVDGRSIYDALHAPKFHLLAFSDGRSDFRALREAAEAELRHVLDFHVIPLYPHVAEVFGAEESFQVLVRPDNHIAMISRDTSLREPSAYLKDVLGLNQHEAAPVSRTGET
jgi:2-polyprenyl-6-methoxyphenol hydroxylase-like FAD-dependent oxidoreductase